MKMDFVRQSTLIPEGIRDMSITIVGCGAIGSHLAECFAKVGANQLTVYDDDTVEAHNLPNQGFYLPDIGKPKVEALKERLEVGTGAEITAYHKKYEGDELVTHVVVSAVDSMAARKMIFRAWQESTHTKIFVDGRMGSRFGKVYLVSKDVPESVGEYVQSLYSDEEAHQEPCTARSTIFCAYGLAALMCSATVGWALLEVTSLELSADFSNFAVLKRTVQG